ncbi:MAG: hypothetical protein ACRDJE_11135 [Dehalococcoidia bacterium]
MTNAETHVLIFKDQAGDHYLLPQKTLERARVPAEDKAELERQIAGSDDVAGYTSMNPSFTVGAAYISVGAMFIGEGIEQGGDPIGGLASIVSGLTLVAQGIVIGTRGFMTPPPPL